MSEAMEKGLVLAKKAIGNAYCPYSGFSVGAAVKFSNHKEIYSGCNVENGSYPNSACAELSAITTAVSMEGPGELDWVIVLANVDTPVPPCGSCLQVIGEFGTPETTVRLVTKSGAIQDYRYGDLAPHHFNLDDHQ